MADEDLLRRIHGLEDLDLASLLCLISREHCIISTEPSELDDLVEELRLVASQTFHLPSSVVDCTPYTTLDDLAASIQLHPPAPPPPPTPQRLHTPTPRTPSASPLRSRRGTESSYFRGSPSHGNTNTYTTTTTATATAVASTPSRNRSHSHSHSHHYPPPPPPQIANVILAKNLDRAPKDVQIQCLELLRTRRILTRTSVQTAPKQFLFVAVLESGGAARLVSHLNDLFYVSHWHDPEDGFAHLEEEEQDQYRNRDRGDGDDGDRRGGETASLASTSSVVIRRSIAEPPSTPRVSRARSTRTNPNPIPIPTKPADQASSYSASISSSRLSFPSITDADITSLALLARNVSLDIEVLRYQMNIVSFLRMHRAVAPAGGGVTPQATKHFEQLAKSLAALHGLDYVTPSLVALAVKKAYAHRIRVTTPEKERSLQWGSEIGAVEALLEGVDAEYVIEDVLGMVEAPL
ncbi:hypothetical protein F4781DRAFT_385566 [Annulohypoxylon bovei var. microspora]|nr:hypothetical protein F4781DRAFT_385566 [Annulohypoxylon bovei var. microspora]